MRKDLLERLLNYQTIIASKLTIEDNEGEKVAIIVEVNIVPLGVGISVSKFLVPAITELKRRGVKYEVTPMCTVFAAENVEDAFNIIKAAHEAVFGETVQRVVTTFKIDDRRDIKRGMKEKVESLKKEVKR